MPENFTPEAYSTWSPNQSSPIEAQETQGLTEASDAFIRSKLEGSFQIINTIRAYFGINSTEDNLTEPALNLREKLHNYAKEHITIKNINSALAACVAIAIVAKTREIGLNLDSSSLAALQNIFLLIANSETILASMPNGKIMETSDLLNNPT